MNSVQPGSKSDADAGTPKRAPKVGDWIVVKRDYPGFRAAGPVSKTTAQRVYHPDWYTPTRESFSPDHAVLFVGSEADAKRVSELLTSSKALCDNERRESGVRHEQRIVKICARAGAGNGTASTTDDSRAPGMNPQPAQGTDQ